MPLYKANYSQEKFTVLLKTVMMWKFSPVNLSTFIVYLSCENCNVSVHKQVAWKELYSKIWWIIESCHSYVHTQFHKHWITVNLCKSYSSYDSLSIENMISLFHVYTIPGTLNPSNSHTIYHIHTYILTTV